MEITEDLLCLFSAEIEQRGTDTVIRVPAEELDLGELAVGETYRVAVLSQSKQSRPTPQPRPTASQPPVEEGETIDVEVESIGDQGDGIARVDRGYVIIVPDTDVGDRVTVEVTTVKENMAFAEVLEHHRVA